MFFTTTKCAVLVQERSGVFPDLFLYCEIKKNPPKWVFLLPRGGNMISMVMLQNLDFVDKYFMINAHFIRDKSFAIKFINLSFYRPKAIYHFIEKFNP